MQAGRESELFIPHHLQKNATEESIPLLSWFETVLLETPDEFRTGRAFNPGPVTHSQGRPSKPRRPNADWVGKVISRIGERAGIVVHEGDPRTGRKPRYASAHDLRRSCTQRLMDEAVPAELIQRVLRHASFETTKRHDAGQDVQRDAKAIKNIVENGQVA